ncbi:MAG: hypothetical protein AAGF30_13615 [Pseudomonadota bacterium]
MFRLVAGEGGLLADPGANVVDLIFLGLPIAIPILLLIPRALPAAIRAPSRWYHVLLVLLVVQLITMGGTFPLAIQAVSDGIDLEAWDDGIEIYELMGFLAVLGVLITSIVSVARGGRSGSTYTPHMVDGPIPGGAPMPAPAPAQRTTLERVHLFFIRLTGVAMFGTVAWGTVTQPNPIVWAVIAAAVGLLTAILFLSPRWTPRVIARPSRWYHFFGFNLLTGFLMCLALLPFAYGTYEPIFTQAFEDARAGIERSPEEIAAMATATLTQGPGLLAFALIGIPLQLAWFTMIGLLFQKPSSEAGMARTKRAPVANPELPAISAAMKLYQIADWVVLRALGLALLWTAYMMWQVIQADRVWLIDALAQGIDPMTALFIYAGLGAFLVVPFIMPRFLSSPRHVVGGLAKSFLLVVAALVLIAPLNVAIVLYTPDIYHATLHATAPRAFKAVAGIAVSSALLISFFRQLSSVPQIDYQGRAVRVYSNEELAEMRRARMDIQAPSH